MRIGKDSTGIIYLVVITGILLYSCSPSEEKIIPKSHTIEIKAMQFQPSEILVQKGDTVLFFNNDIVVHDITEQQTKSWNSAPLSAGQTFRLVVIKNTDYYCSIHPVMQGRILVK